MPFLFQDTSALAKRYLLEPGSQWVAQLTTPRSGNICAMSNITKAKMIAAIHRRVRMGLVNMSQGRQAIAVFLGEYQHNFRRVVLTSTIIDHAFQLISRHPLRGYDAVQLASALWFHQGRSQQRLTPLTFISADANLNNAAQAEGLLVDDPNLHP